MEKIKLNLDDLRVESFQTGPDSASSRGTVHGLVTNTELENCTGPDYNTCAAGCTLLFTDNGAHTCAATCGGWGSCMYCSETGSPSCDPFCQCTDMCR